TRLFDFLDYLPHPFQNGLVLDLLQVPREALPELCVHHLVLMSRKTSSRVTGLVCSPSRIASTMAKSSTASAKIGRKRSRCSCNISTSASLTMRFKLASSASLAEPLTFCLRAVFIGNIIQPPSRIES